VTANFDSELASTSNGGYRTGRNDFCRQQRVIGLIPSRRWQRILFSATGIDALREGPAASTGVMTSGFRGGTWRDGEVQFTMGAGTVDRVAKVGSGWRGRTAWNVSLRRASST
jgi:hypothetical protein